VKKPQPNLAAALHKASGKVTPAVEVKEAAPAVAPIRRGKRLIAAHFDPAVARQLKMVAADEETTIQALLTEALNDFFIKRGKPPIA
jgi:hypothetical protein